MTNIAEMTQADIDAFMAEHTKKVMRAQERHATRMKAKRAVIAEKKKEIIEKGEDIVLCLDCRNGSPEIMSSMLIAEQKPRHPIVERRDARATGRLVIDHRPDGWTRFGSIIPTEQMPDTPASFSAAPGDRGVHIGVVINAEEDEEVDQLYKMPFHQGNEPGSVRIDIEEREAFIDPKYAGMERGRKRNYAWSM